MLDLLHCCQSLREPVTLIARLRLDAALYAPAPPRQPGQNGRPPLKGPRRPPLKVLLEQTDVTWASAEVAWYDGITRAVELTSQTAVWYRSGKPPVLIRWVLIRDPQGSFATQALLCTDPAADPTQILEWFVLRWQLEVTFHEVRTHLGVETQRQWSDLAIARTTPALLGLFSWTTLAAHALQKRHPMTQRKAAWYDKPSPTFVDAIALARRHLWLASEGFSLSVADPDIQELPVALYHRHRLNIGIVEIEVLSTLGFEALPDAFQSPINVLDFFCEERRKSLGSGNLELLLGRHYALEGIVVDEMENCFPLGAGCVGFAVKERAEQGQSFDEILERPRINQSFFKSVRRVRLPLLDEFQNVSHLIWSPQGESHTRRDTRGQSNRQVVWHSRHRSSPG